MVLIPTALLTVLSACTGGGGDTSSTSGNGLTRFEGTSIPGIPSAHADETPASAPTATAAAAGTSCHSDDPSHVCLGMKYVVFKDSSGKPVVSKEEAAANVQQINDVWKQCSLGFQIDEFVEATPKDAGLNYNTADYTELDDIRKKFEDDKTLLVVTTGSWDRNGSIGSTGANAWTSMPGESLYGAILEKSVGTFGNIIAHELGHYIGLDHADDTSNLMNPVIYDKSKGLSKSQCDTARKTTADFWQRMLR
jgi:hypothetical protein